MALALEHLTGSVHVAPNVDTLCDDLARALLGAAAAAVKARDVFHLALSGGSTPQPFYERLVIDPRFRELPWPQTHLWVVDERRVLPEDPRSNWRMIRETLADHVPMKTRQKHPMPVTGEDPAGVYEAEIRSVVPVDVGTKPQAAIPRLDFVLLGMGDDAHTASLFPGSPALDVSDRLVAVNTGPTVTPPDRVTMTFPLLNAARRVAVLVTGAKKSAMLSKVEQRMREHGPDRRKFPITGVRPSDGVMTWYLDAAAAGH